MNQAKRKLDIVLILAALLSAFFNFYGIWEDKFVNSYYTAAVKSMLQSFHNFFYASFDPGGYVTVDKPPVAFWLQTVSASIFGLHGWSVILPQALAGVGSTLLIYFLVKPKFGLAAARIAAVTLACTPVAAAVARTNNVDSLLVFTLLLGTWMLFRAVRRSQPGWVLGAFAMIGVGFNVKMLQAYMVVPAFYLFYLLAFKVNWKKKWVTLAGATLVLAVVSVSWAVVVDSVPEDQRPYIGSSQTNSVLELAFGYNGVSRLTGDRSPGGAGGGAPGGFNRDEMRQGFPGGSMNEGTGNGQDSETSGAAGSQGQTPVSDPDGSQNQAQGQSSAAGNSGAGWQNSGDGSGRGAGRMDGQGFPGGGGGGGMFNTGTPGVFRLFQTELSGQASWMLPFAAFGVIGLLAGWSWRRALTDRQKESLFWLAWLIPVMGFFSVAGFFHQYYLVMLGPPIAALVAIGWVTMWSMYRDKAGWTAWLLPAAVLVTAAFEAFVLRSYTEQIGSWLMILVIILGAAAAVALAALRSGDRRKLALAAVSLVILLIIPAYWSATPIIYGQSSQLPAAGPGESRFGRMNETVNEQLLDYVTKHNTGEKYLFAASNAMSTASYILETGKPVMAMGGYSGSDPILTVAKLEKLVAEHQVKFFLVSSGGMSRGDSSDVTEWIKEHGTEVPEEEWNDTTSSDESGQAQAGDVSTDSAPRKPSGTAGTNQPGSGFGGGQDGMSGGMNRGGFPGGGFPGGGFGGMGGGTLYEIKDTTGGE
ncbi:glycosyltransferase family 39 protein [Paenibacillus sp. XY044]|uniref:glycosyltransferase family 39 protein n=1 Tax=Paenibacillus sp. XY044 TaxID=2026089 RepID=UPI00359C7D96